MVRAFFRLALKIYGLQGWIGVKVTIVFLNIHIEYPLKMPFFVRATELEAEIISLKSDVEAARTSEEEMGQELAGKDL